MARHTTFSQKVAAGFGISVVLTAAVGAIAVVALQGVVTSKDRVIAGDARRLVEAERLRVAAEQKVGAGRAYLLTGDERFFEQMRAARAGFATDLDRLRQGGPTTRALELLAVVERTEDEHQQGLDSVLALRRAG